MRHSAFSLGLRCLDPQLSAVGHLYSQLSAVGQMIHLQPVTRLCRLLPRAPLHCFPAAHARPAQEEHAETMPTDKAPRTCVCGQPDHPREHIKYEQGVAAGARVCCQRRHSGFSCDAWPDEPCEPAVCAPRIVSCPWCCIRCAIPKTESRCLP